MKTKIMVLVALFVATSSSCFAAKPQTFSYAGTTITAKQITGFYPSKATAEGQVHLSSINKVAKTAVEAHASKMTAVFFAATAGKTHPSGLDSVKSADLLGPVK